MDCNFAKFLLSVTHGSATIAKKHSPKIPENNQIVVNQGNIGLTLKFLGPEKGFISGEAILSFLAFY
jgi:hypothetical protein